MEIANTIWAETQNGTRILLRYSRLNRLFVRLNLVCRVNFVTFFRMPAATEMLRQAFGASFPMGDLEKTVPSRIFNQGSLQIPFAQS